MKTTTLDKIILFILATLIFIFFWNQYKFSEYAMDEFYAEIKSPEGIQNLPLKNDNYISLKNNKVGIIIKDRKCYFAENDCPNQTCVHSGYVTTPGQILVCLPNKIIITIKKYDDTLIKKKKIEEYDAVTK